MPYSRPTLQELKERSKTDMEARTGVAPLNDNAVLTVISEVQAGGTHSLHGSLDFTSKQILPDTSESEFLTRHASIWGIPRKASTFGTGTAEFTGTDGSAIASGITLQLAGSDVEYITTASGIIAAGVASIPIVAKEAGADSNASENDELSLISPIAGVSSIALIGPGGVASGSDEESDASLLVRVLERIQEPPHGGADFDYSFWAKQVDDVTRVFVTPLVAGAGTVGVSFTVDELITGPIPSPTKVQEVQDFLDLNRPVTAQVIVFGLTEEPLNPEISLKPNTAEVQAAVILELQDIMRREAQPGGTLLLSKINEAISVASGEDDHVLTLPVANIVYANDKLGVLGTPVFSTLA